MENIKLSNKVFIRLGRSEVALLLPEKDQIFNFKGDIGKLVVILYDGRGRKTGFTEASLEKKLASVSARFAKSRAKKQCLSEALEYLSVNGLLQKT